MSCRICSADSIDPRSRQEVTIRPFALLLLTPLLAAAAPPPVPAYRSFGRWFVACDNTRACVARGFDESTQAQLDLTSPAGPAAPTFSLSAADAFDRAGLQLDGKPLPLPSPAWSGDQTGVGTSDPAAVTAFIATVRDGRAITLSAPDPDGSARTVPLEGFVAALRFVDAVQGRPGTPTALVADKGSASPLPPLPLPAPPVWRAASPLSKAEIARLEKQANTLRSPAFGACDVKQPAQFYALDAEQALIIRPCYQAAYQGSSIVMTASRSGGAPRPVSLALPGISPVSKDGPDMVDPEFDPASGTLATTSKGRGLADCGSSEVWVWSTGAFRILSLNYQDQCGGAEPGDWPPLFRSRKS